MSSFTQTIVVGNLGSAPEKRHLPTSGKAVTVLSVATAETWKGEDGTWQESTEWHRVVVYGQKAEYLCEYARKGSKVFIEGKNRTRKYTDKAGIERSITEVVANGAVKILDPKPPTEAGGHAPTTDGHPDFPDEDISF